MRFSFENKMMHVFNKFPNKQDRPEERGGGLVWW